MTRLLAFVASVFVGLAWPLAALAEKPVVVELFTSQGCSSCPPADELLRELSKREDIIPLALHVDYWDYIGWKDSFADPRFTARQKAYARRFGERSVFTPQMVIHGRKAVIGSRAMEVAMTIQEVMESQDPVLCEVRRSGDRVRIEVKADGGQGRPAVIHLVRYRPEAVVQIERGENAGRTLRYTNIVTDWRTVGEWDGRADAEFEVRLDPSELPAVVLVQEKGMGPMLAAERVR